MGKTAGVTRSTSISVSAGIARKSFRLDCIPYHSERARRMADTGAPLYNSGMDPLVIAGREFRSRLIVGTGKYRSFQENARALEASGADMVTVAVRRVNLTDRTKESLLDFIDRSRYKILPNTAGCTTAKDAVLTAQLAREALGTDLIKLEVIGDTETLYPDTAETIVAARELVKDGFTVLPYIIDDPTACKRLEDAGCAAVMPLGAPMTRSSPSPCRNDDRSKQADAP